MNTPKIVEGQWYSDTRHGDVFWVIAVDEQAGLIDVRDGFGEIDEIDFDEWEMLGLELCAAPPAPLEPSSDWAHSAHDDAIDEDAIDEDAIDEDAIDEDAIDDED